jgi:hypothetical protein
MKIKALVPVLVSFALVTAAAAQQITSGGPRRGYTPEPGAKDLKATLFNWTWHMGMLRGAQEIEAVATLEHTATGVIQVDGQPCKLSKYRVSTNYQVAGQRIQYTCARPNGQQYTNVEVVSGQFAWDEDIPGAEIVPGKGKATPKPAAHAERAIRLWASPQGAPKAAIAGGDKTTVDWSTGKAVVTFPIPGVPGAIATATLSDKFQAERVDVTHNGVVTEFTYGKYDDWNNELNKVEAFYAGTLVEKRGGTTLRDLTTVETETGNVYVVVPVPASIRSSK